MYENINDILYRKERKIQEMFHIPLIARWASLETMNGSLSILNKKIGHLLDNFTNGGEGKLNQWLFSNDIDFCNITAERYIVEYLKSKNDNICDNFAKKGVDAKILSNNTNIGIEVTTLSGFVSEWIYIERLVEILNYSFFIKSNSIIIKSKSSYIVNKIQNKSIEKILEFINQIAELIITNDKKSLEKLDIYIKIRKNNPGCITFEFTKDDNDSWLKYLTSDLLKKITSGAKFRQLEQQSKNIIFVGVNNMFSPNWIIPSIFNEIGNGGISYKEQIEYIQKYWNYNLRNHSNILGVCYFCYSLDSEEPFYPLKIFWRDKSSAIALNL